METAPESQVESMMTLAIVLLLLIILILVGLPLAVGFGICSLILTLFWGIKPIYAAITVFKSVDSFTLLAVPLFILAGHLMGSSGVSSRLIGFADSIFGRMKGGLGAAGIFATMIFGAMCGSSVATVATMGSILIPKMEERGYPRRYTTALVSCSGLLGQLIPPSVPMIIYAMVLGVNVAVLFLSTVIPGLIMATGYIIVNYFVCRQFATVSVFGERKVGMGEQAKMVAKAGWHAILGLLAPVILLGGIYGGVFTPTEAAAVAILYIIPVGFLAYRILNLKSFIQVLVDAGRIIGALFVLFAFVVLFGKILAMERIPAEIASAVLSLSDNRYVILAMINVLLLGVGMLMDDISGALVTLPILIPIIEGLGMDRIQLAAILATNLGCGLMTPPVAPNLFVGAMVGRIHISEFMKYVLPFLIFVGLPTVILTTYVRDISLFLPRLLMGAH